MVCIRDKVICTVVRLFTLKEKKEDQIYLAGCKGARFKFRLRKKRKIRFYSLGAKGRGFTVTKYVLEGEIRPGYVAYYFCSRVYH